MSTTATPTAARWLRPYAVAYLWALTGLLAIADAAAAVPLARDVAHLLLPLDWRHAPHDPNAHDIATALGLWFHNARLALAPLAAAAAVQHRPGRLRQAVDVLLAVVFAINVIPVGVELGTWGAQLLPYIPNAPVELLALVIGPVSWWLVTRGRLPPRSLWLIAAIVVALLAVAACLETWVPPQTRRSSDAHTRMAMVAAPSGAALRATALTRPLHPRSHHVMSPTTTPHTPPPANRFAACPSPRRAHVSPGSRPPGDCDCRAAAVEAVGRRRRHRPGAPAMKTKPTDAVSPTGYPPYRRTPADALVADPRDYSDLWGYTSASLDRQRDHMAPMWAMSVAQRIAATARSHGAHVGDERGAADRGDAPR